MPACVTTLPSSGDTAQPTSHQKSDAKPGTAPPQPRGLTKVRKAHGLEACASATRSLAGGRDADVRGEERVLAASVAAKIG